LNDFNLFQGTLKVGEAIPGLTSAGIATFTAVGAAFGSFIGLDREYVRRFLDVSENTLNDPVRQHEQMIAKVKQVERLGEVAAKSATAEISTSSIHPISKPPQDTLITAHVPDTKVHHIAHERQRLVQASEQALIA